MKLHIPDVLLPDGTHIWMDLEYDTTLSIDGNIYFHALNYGTPTSTECTATIDGNILHIPYLSYADPTSGNLSFGVDLVYEYNPSYSTLMSFKLTNSAVINDSTFSCAASTLSGDFKIHIPDVLLQDGTHVWMDLEYSPALSIDGNVYFVVTEFGAVSN